MQTPSNPPCPHCGHEKVHRKAPQFVASLDKTVRRYYCANGCRRYHLRDMETGELLEAGKRPLKTYAPSVAGKPLEEHVADVLGVDTAALKFTATNSSGRPRALVNCLSDADIAHLGDEDAAMVRKLQHNLLVIQACIGVYRERAFAAAKAKA